MNYHNDRSSHNPPSQGQRRARALARKALKAANRGRQARAKRLYSLAMGSAS